MKVRHALAAFMIVALAVSALSAEPQNGSVCIAPGPKENDYRSSPGLFCKFEDFAFTIDGKGLPWPTKESLKVAGLDAGVRHRVVVLCKNKPQQSFVFHFSEFRTKELCLFLNDLYKTVQLEDTKQCPWCKCK